MQVASRIMEQVNAHEPDAVFIDATGIGWGVCDRLAQPGCQRAASTSPSAPTAPTAARPSRATPRSERRCGGSLGNGAGAGCLPDDAELIADLGNVEYGCD